MSIWTSNRGPGAAVLAALFLLSGCIGFDGFGRDVTAPREASVTSDRVTISGPDGFCVDPTATRDEDDTGFVLLGNCAAISNSRLEPQPAVPVILTAAVSGASQGSGIEDSLSELDDFFRSDEGQRLLSRGGVADSVEILETETEGNVFYLRARDTSANPIGGVEDWYWRAYLDLDQRIVTLTVLGLSEQRVSNDTSRDTLRRFAAAVQRANALRDVNGVLGPQMRPVPAPRRPGAAAPTVPAAAPAQTPAAPSTTSPATSPPPAPRPPRASAFLERTWLPSVDLG